MIPIRNRPGPPQRRRVVQMEAAASSFSLRGDFGVHDFGRNDISSQSKLRCESRRAAAKSDPASSRSSSDRLQCSRYDRPTIIRARRLAPQAAVGELRAGSVVHRCRGHHHAVRAPRARARPRCWSASPGCWRRTRGASPWAARFCSTPRRKVNVPVASRRVAYVFQTLALFPHMSVEANIAYGLDRLPGEQRRAAVDAIVDAFRIGHARQRRPGEISGGERQRTALARALVTNPRVLLLDEPLSALDVSTKTAIIQDLRAWNDAHGIPALYVTHSRDELFALGEGVIALEQGRVAAEGTAAGGAARSPAGVDGAGGGFRKYFRRRRGRAARGPRDHDLPHRRRSATWKCRSGRCGWATRCASAFAPATSCWPRRNPRG